MTRAGSDLETCPDGTGGAATDGIPVRTVRQNTVSRIGSACLRLNNMAGSLIELVDHKLGAVPLQPYGRTQGVRSR